MNDIKFSLEELRTTVAENVSAAKQGLDLPELNIKQLHPSKEQQEKADDITIQDFFFLVIQVNDTTCKIIPGSFDGLMAGPNDIVLPKNILGQYVYLSMDMQANVPKNALSNGFAILDNTTFERILASQKEFNNEHTGNVKPFARAMPYISDHDDRIEYHRQQQALLERMQNTYSKPRLLNFPQILKFRHFSKVAGLLLFALLGVLFLFTQKSPENMPPTIAPTGITRGVEDSLIVYSPRNAMYSTEPKIVIGGNSNLQYEITVMDTDDKVIAQTVVSGASQTHWDDFSRIKLSAGETYYLQIKQGEKTVAAKNQNTFWILEKDEKNALSAELNKLGKHETPGFGTTAFAPSLKINDKDLFRKAQLLYEKGCYSETYLEITELLKNDKDNKVYKELQSKCLNELGIRNKEDQGE